jgi:hypothetical protein
MDQFSSISLNRTSQLVRSPDSFFRIWIPPFVTPKKYPWNYDVSLTSPFYSFVITLDHGLLSNTSLSFTDACADNICLFDANAPCIQGTECGIVPPESDLLKIYVTFTGTDSFFEPMESSSNSLLGWIKYTFIKLNIKS